MSRETIIVQHFGFGTVSILWISSPSGAVVLSSTDNGLINACTKSGSKSKHGHRGHNKTNRLSLSYYFFSSKHVPVVCKLPVILVLSTHVKSHQSVVLVFDLCLFSHCPCSQWDPGCKKKQKTQG